MLLQIDSRRRLTLPLSSGIKPGDVIDLEILDDGRVMVVPVEVIPKHQLWAWTAESRITMTSSMSDPRPSEVVDTPEEAKKVATKWTDES